MSTAKKKRKRKPPKFCPIHNVKLAYSPNSYGSHWHCPEDGCTVRCCGGDTSTPGDHETFEERKKAHAMFDPLWKGGYFGRRHQAYLWMQRTMGTDIHETHIGMFTAEQCRELCRQIEAMLTIATADGKT